MTYLHRRAFLASAAALGASPLLDAARAHAAGRVKITGLRQVPLKVLRKVGTYPDFLNRPREVNVGGGAFLEVQTDAGITGIGPDIDPSLLKAANDLLVGQDPFDINLLAARLYLLPTGANTVSMPVKFRGGASAEIAVWDLIGKLANQPLYKLWGGGRDAIAGYASMLRLSTPEERAEQGVRQKAAGWKAMKLRAGYPTMAEDIRLMEVVRKAVGDDFMLMADANKAILQYGVTNGVRWDYPRAVQTALAYQKLGVWLLEEPFERTDYDHMADLNRQISMNLAGGEGNRGIEEFRKLLDDCYDVVQPEIMITGVRQMQQIAVMAESRNRMCMPHQGDSRLGTIATMHLVASWPETVAPMFEIFNDTPVGDYTYPFEIFEKPPAMGKDGLFAMPDAPGLGMTIAKDAIGA